jgi:imidazole glycerol-phosphate synthase subunit HisF
MIQPRVIPCLLLRGHGLVKTRKFDNAVYVGDPINAVRIFSEKEADEIVILDIDASREGRAPNYELIAEIAGEAFMPVAYGGGVRSVEQIRRLIRSGVEKVVINTAATESTSTIRSAVEAFGSQAIVGGVDVKRKIISGYTVTCKSDTIGTSLNLGEHIASLVEAGVGELFINDVTRDGCMSGYDMELIRNVAKAPVPVVVCGGAGAIEHMREAVLIGGASAAAAGSIFVFHGKHKAVLINYPTSEDLKSLFLK